MRIPAELPIDLVSGKGVPRHGILMVYGDQTYEPRCLQCGWVALRETNKIKSLIRLNTHCRVQHVE